MPSDTNPVADLPWIGVRPECIDDPGDLVAGGARIDHSRKRTVLGQSVAMADAARLNLDSGAAATRVGNGRFVGREISAGTIHDYFFHWR
jgi:hypothetical protein